MPNQLRFMSRILAVSAICVGILALILISPLILLELSHVKNENWQQLSNIGQTYGVSSAILAGIALLGVVFSLVVQARQAKTERIRIVRERHMELLQIVLNDPEHYGPIMGANPGSGADHIRSRLFVTMWLNYARMGYQMDVLTERSLRADLFKSMFQSDLARSWWSDIRELWLNSPVPDRRARKFAQITDDEYQKAIIAGPAPITILNNATNDAEANGKSYNRWREPIAIASGIAIGIFLRSHITRKSGHAREQSLYLRGRLPSQEKPVGLDPLACHIRARTGGETKVTGGQAGNPEGLRPGHAQVGPLRETNLQARDREQCAKFLSKRSCQLSLDSWSPIESAWLLDHAGRILAAQQRSMPPTSAHQ